SSTSPAVEIGLQKGGCFKNAKGQFTDVNLALAWCEEQLLAAENKHVGIGSLEFERWLQRQLGPGVVLQEIFAYLDVKTTTGSEVIYRQGDPADTMDVV